ncbi:cytochrome c biogenesis protein [Geobacter anodireducens]|uniref:Cytochrome C biogenesis protein ResC n=1 Tax=Geobacter soli TaxID=1510391 RepID=A0A0C1QR49_9BACT|nr:cytochrome c biogenesis protein CcsA [Geobacter soli]ANA41128.1 cytochrome C biogenesis protein ResC [Geobacter anodireducens]KIE43252.1 cytochrome C biogenesis protein ResC [Geobacter soli]HMN03521.1 cytochrome c biogenesis protein CcsA [Geobacter anodireducens]
MDSSFAHITIIHWVAVVVYVIATIFNVSGLMFRKERAVAVSEALVLGGLLVHGIGILWWWKIVGHGPYIGRFEVLSSHAWAVLALFMTSARFFPRIKAASILVFPVTFLMIAVGLFIEPQAKMLPPTLRSVWLVLHVIFYKISLFTLLVALAFSLFYLLRKRTGISWLQRLPELEILDILSFRFAGFSFTFWGIAMVAGSIWAYQSWGRFWGWDPVETWSLMTWIAFGIYLHLRRFFGWNGERAAYLYLICFVLSVISLLFTPLIGSSIHSEYFK